MGSFFTNVQVRLDDADAAGARKRILTALEEFAVRDGLVAAKKGEGSDRTMLVWLGSPWVSIYDELSESQNLEVSDALGAALSRYLERPAVSVLVHDSDVLELRLFAAGKLVDRYNSAPSYFKKVTAAEIAAAKGRPERWRKVIGDSIEVGDLREAWSAEQGDEPFAAESVLENTASALALEHERVSVGYNNTTSDPSSDVRKGARGVVELRWRKADRQRLKSKSKALPDTTFSAWSPVAGEPTVQVGETQPRYCSVRNEGAASEGLSLVVSGPALDEEHVVLESLTIGIGVLHGGKLARLERWNDERGRSSYIATLPNASVFESPLARTAQGV